MFERDKAKIVLKWPLAKAMITSDKKIDEEMKKIIAKQLNVKEIETREGNDIKIEIDTKATPELEAEGYAREFTRKVQAERKNKGLKKGELIVLKVSTDKKLKQTLVENIEFLKERTNSKKIEFFDDKLGENAVDFAIRDRKISIELE